MTRRRLLVRALVGLATLIGTLLILPGTAFAACSWTDPLGCIPRPGSGATSCAEAPSAQRPESGTAGWIASRPRYYKETGKDTQWKPNSYDLYAYGGLSFDTYDLGCGPSAVRDPGATASNTIANVIWTPAVVIVAGDNALREIAYDPDKIWGWTNDLVANATVALRDRIFTPWGAIGLIVVGAWLLWGSRSGRMSSALLTAGWAVLVMVTVTAIASWPLQSSRLADSALTTGIDTASTALSPQNVSDDDPRTGAQRASGQMTDLVLYRAWLRGTLGSDSSVTAKKYGPLLLQARSVSWAEAERMDKDPDERNRILKQKAELWNSTAAQVKEEDPQAYDYLTGKRGSDRIGAAVVGLLAAVAVTPFDLAANVLILLAFLIIRLAVVFAPVLGAFGILAPASGPLRRLLFTVVAAIFNTIVFAAGSAVYLFSLSLIMGTSSHAGWQQVFLLWIVGLVLWLVLRPYRKITQLGGKDPFGELTSGLGRLHATIARDVKDVAKASAGAYLGDAAALDRQEKKAGKQQSRELELRPEAVGKRPPQLALENGERRDVNASDDTIHVTSERIQHDSRSRFSRLAARAVTARTEALAPASASADARDSALQTRRVADALPRVVTSLRELRTELGQEVRVWVPNAGATSTRELPTGTTEMRAIESSVRRIADRNSER